jgi:hypothetical protein
MWLSAEQRPSLNHRSVSLEGAGPTAMKVLQIGQYVWVPCQALMYWPCYKRAIERCLVQYGGKSGEEAAGLVGVWIRRRSGDDDFTLFHELPWYCAMDIFVFLVALGVGPDIFPERGSLEAAKLGTPGGTLLGLAVTGGVIAAANIVLAGTFAALARQKTVEVTEVGIAVALGVLLDALLVRTMLVAAPLLALDEHAWWSTRRGGRRPKWDDVS